MQKLPTIYLVIAAIVLFGVFFLFFRNGSNTSVINTSTSTSTEVINATSKTTTTKPKDVSNQTSSSHVYISIMNNSFSPKSLTIKAGTLVTWTNKDSIIHKVLADNGGPTSGDLLKGQSYTFRYATKGIYGYHLYESSTTTGTIIVN